MTCTQAIQALHCAERRYDIDVLRVLAFAILILYHTGMFYVADWGWHVKSTYLSETLQLPMLLVNHWRLPLLFVISGISVNFILRRTKALHFTGQRARRLMIPLLFGMAVVVPPQAYVQALENHAFAGSYGAFLIHYFSFQPWPIDAFDGSEFGLTWNHLWYLPYLFCYTALLALLLPLLRSKLGLWWRARFCALRGLGLILLPALPLVFATWWLSARYPTTHALLDDWHTHAIYFPVFLYGYWMGTDAGLWQALQRLRWTLTAFAVAVFAAFLLLDEILLLSSPDWQRATYDFFDYLDTWVWILMLMAWAFTLLNKPYRWLTYANEAVYPWYILHQTITVCAGYWLSGYQLGPLLEPLILVGITIFGCLVLHEYAIRRVRILRPLFGLKTMGQGTESQTVVLQATGKV